MGKESLPERDSVGNPNWCDPLPSVFYTRGTPPPEDLKLSITFPFPSLPTVFVSSGSLVVWQFDGHRRHRIGLPRQGMGVNTLWKD